MSGSDDYGHEYRAPDDPGIEPVDEWSEAEANPAPSHFLRALVALVIVGLVVAFIGFFASLR